MSRRRYGGEKASLRPLIVICNILIAGVLFLMLFFAYRYFTEIEDEQSADEPELELELELDEFINTDEEVVAIDPPPPPEITRATTTPPPDMTAPEAVFIPDYDDEFFGNSLFIGDSIMTGIHLYGYIPANNVFAKVGVNPDSVSYTEIDGQTALQKAESMRPARVYVMLGSNGISFIPAYRMVEFMEDLMAELGRAVPDSQVVLLTIPPVTFDYELENPETTDKIKDFNRQLLESAARNNYFIVDITSVLSTNEGYLSHTFAEVDGLHLKNETYKAILSHIQHTVEGSSRVRDVLNYS